MMAVMIIGILYSVFVACVLIKQHRDIKDINYTIEKTLLFKGLNRDTCDNIINRMELIKRDIDNLDNRINILSDKIDNIFNR